MILLPRSFYDAAAFAEGLNRASRGVLRVLVEAGPSQMFSTGWLVTDTLVVLPDSSASVRSVPSSQHTYSCHPPSKGDKPRRAIKADLVTEVGDSPDGSRPALLRLRKALVGCALSLEMRAVEPGNPVVILQYPGGRQQLQFSVGNLTGAEGAWVRYDANTEAGSGGSPVLGADTWTLVGMHVKASPRDGFNEGLSLMTLLASLRETPVWREIALHHNLVDVSAARRTLGERGAPAMPLGGDTLPTAAAMRWDFRPEALRELDRERLRPLVNDPSAPVWSLAGKERQRLIRQAGTLGALRNERRRRLGTKDARPAGEDEAEAPDELGQRVIDRILEGPPYSLEEIGDAELPYWLQAVRWFSAVEEGLPTPGEVNRTLERRRVRSRLLTVAGPDFKGRVRELTRMRDWYVNAQAGPLVISGIGGIGKSALVARFATGLPVETPLLWLDFDRADLAPDDAESVLSLLSEQMSAQLDGFTPPAVDADKWDKAADTLGAALGGRGARPPLVVLDGFEVAQHALEHHKIWEVLERVLANAPELRVIVSGRAAVQSLKLGGREAVPLALEGMDASDAAAWLREHGINDDEVGARVVQISNGVPLVLRLALRWVEEGGKVSDLPEELPKALVEGFLYQRILDRVIDRQLKPVAQDALVLRSLTREMITAVLSDSIPEGLDAGAVFSLLTREMGLVRSEEGQTSTVLLGGTAGLLRLRPEVRSATLRLLEMDKPERVRVIDRRAADWYATQNSADAANAAELVYHLLRLGDVEGAEAAWHDDSAPLLSYAEEELPESEQAARAWLRERTRDASTRPAGLDVWEREAMSRIRSAVARGLLRAVPEVLGERSERSPASPLVLYDAWARWLQRDSVGARAILREAGGDDGHAGRDRAVLGALLAVQDGDLREADGLLASIEDVRRWEDRPDCGLEALAVSAARVRLTVNLTGELELYNAIRDELNDYLPPKVLKLILTAADVMLPGLCRRLVGAQVSESAGSSLKVPSSPGDLDLFARRLHEQRRRHGPNPLGLWPAHITRVTDVDPWAAEEIKHSPVEQGDNRPRRLRNLGLDLSVLAWRRWRLAASSLFLARACEQALRHPESNNTLSLAVTGTLAAFRGQPMEFSSSSGFFPSLDHVLGRSVRMNQKSAVPVSTPERFKLAEDLLLLEAKTDPSGPQALLKTLDSFGKLVKDAAKKPVGTRGAIINSLLPDYLIDRMERTGLHSVVLYLLGPDPLEVLCRRVVGLPDNL